MQLQPLRFGVVGLGVFGEAHLSCLRGLRAATGIELAAVCSHTAERARSLAQEYGVPRWYTEVAALAQDPELDAVCVTTAEHEHAAATIACLQAGKHVLVEKPLATTLTDADAMIAAAVQSGQHFLVGHVLRFEVLYTTVQERVAAGDLGELVAIACRRNRLTQEMVRYRRVHPFFTASSHDLDVMLWLTQSRVRRVRAFTRTVRPGPTPDLAWGMLDFHSGVLGSLETVGLAPEQGGLKVDDALNVIGSRGSARIDLTRAPLLVWTEDGMTVPGVSYVPHTRGAVRGALREELLHFIGRLRSSAAPDYRGLAEVRHGVAVTLALIQSAEEDRDVVLAEED
ncbi:MAG: hypothetical protein CL878_07660 [Dehalococcoidia bacterium]|nr:hypothetical protein [Dehalococcoidia bacterium]